jgi:hypothetical protein
LRNRNEPAVVLRWLRVKTFVEIAMTSFRLAMLLTVALVLPVHAEESAFFGPLRSRDLSPFGFLRLDMRPAHAVSIEPGSWAVETEFGYQNTWALSPEVEKYLIAMEPSGRRTLGAAEMQAIEDLPGENYLLDIETATLDLTFHYKIAQNWTAYGIVSAISYQGGFLDSTIEKFHDTFGFSSFGRPAVARNQAALVYNLKGVHLALMEKPTDGGFTDPTIGVRYSGFRFSPNWLLTLEGAAKIPVAGERVLLSTGRTDFGLQASLQRLGIRHAYYANLAAVYYAGAREPVPHDAQIVPTVVLGYEFKWTARTNLNVQAYISNSVYSRKQTDLDELLGMKYEYSLGLRHRRENWLYSFGFTENVQNVNNTPDIGFQFGVAWIPHRRPG